MRSEWKVVVFPLALLLGACGPRGEQTADLPDDLKKDLAAASTSSGELAQAPALQGARRMRFVSDLEQVKRSAPEKRRAAKHPTPPMAHHQMAAAPATDDAPAPASAEESPAPAPAVAAEMPMEPVTASAQGPAAAPASAPAAAPSEVGAGDRGSGGGLGGLLGGIIGAVVIRGGHGGVDHCDPRTDGRARPTVIDRPDFGLPLPTGQVFGGVRRR
jgi:hypothetical protein